MTSAVGLQETAQLVTGEALDLLGS